MSHDISNPVIVSSVRALRALAPAVGNLEQLEAERSAAKRASDRGWFTPEEERCLRSWFARYLTARAGLREVIDDLAQIASPRACQRMRSEEATQLRLFTIAFTAACLLVRAGRFLINDLATTSIVQRKLNELSIEHRIPRKQYTLIYRSLTKPINAWRLAEAMQFADENRAAIDALGSDPAFAPVLEMLRESESAVRIRVSRYVRSRLRYRWHSYRRRRSSAIQQAMFRVLEAFGRVIADVRAPGHRDRVTDDVRNELASLLEPGDVIVSRHDHALSNLFLPGYWPHAALHVGLPAVRENWAITMGDAQRQRWIDPLRILEARKGGVLFRPLHDTFAVDAFAILRPTIGRADIARAVSGAIAHEGKLYNFDFDFFTDDRLVCTEVVYRAYEGVGGISFPLSRRAGKLTLTAEDVLDLGACEQGFCAIAVYGSPNVGNRLIIGAEAGDALRGSYEARHNRKARKLDSQTAEQPEK